MSPKGGKREGAGRKPRFSAPMQRYTVRLTLEEVEYAERIGGNLSEGVRIALERDRQQQRLLE